MHIEQSSAPPSYKQWRSKFSPDQWSKKSVSYGDRQVLHNLRNRAEHIQAIPAACATVCGGTKLQYDGARSGSANSHDEYHHDVTTVKQ